ncbi:MAG: superfamily I DNA and RNA helicase and helicaseubunit [Thermoprotei archaeon]|nr:MAG: superfamily I DNA and RNA helicase and helicaseubunit [Thermoprotei archaeon]
MNTPRKLLEVYNLCIRYLHEAEKLLGKGDPVEASEKLYKVVEECVKALAEVHELEEYRKSLEVGKWNVARLESASRKLAEIYGDDVYITWKIAYEKLHIRGFHERELAPNEVKEEIPRVGMLLAIIKDLVKKLSK